ncbi:MAG: PfkB family carbohydrate kinase [Bifidobacterium sp.]|uniref:PfkB family carbohydrate kinase n=1 Tax=Bifidobacterium sp. TaxID=41200 RepID=UPI0039E9DA5C
MRAPRIFHLAQVCVDITLHIDHLPERGGDVFASNNGISVGGGFNVLYAIRQMRAPVSYMGAIGSGPMADIARNGLKLIDVDTPGAVIADVDTGFSIAMTEPNGERTFVSTRGAETMAPPDSYEKIALVDGDVVYISGYSFVHKSNAEALRRFIRKNTGHFSGHIVFDSSPVIADVSDEDLEMLKVLKPIWSVNEREARILCRRFNLSIEGETDEDRCAILARFLSAPVIIRVGADGAWYGDGSAGSKVTARHIPAYPTTVIDTNGAGDTHAGVLCASLLQGRNLIDGLKLANCAAGLSISQFGPATCPSRETIERSVSQH